MQRMRARDKSDNDQRHQKSEEELAKHWEMLTDHATNFESMATVTTMLIENVNMQMEAELSDLVDRQMISLFAGKAPPGAKIETQEAYTTSKELKE